MNKDQFSDALGKVNEKYIIEAATYGRKKRKKTWLKRGTMAACLCLIAAASCFAVTHFHRTAPSVPEPIISEPGTNSNPSNVGKTSDTYGNLRELLEELGQHEEHNGKETPDGNGVSASRIDGQDTVSFGEYVYQLTSDSAIAIYKDGDRIGTVDTTAEYLFLWNSRLIAVGTQMHPETSISVSIFDVTASPEKPAQLEHFIQLGSLTACYLVDGQLYLMTSDGICACGWSRLDSVEDYIPQLWQGEEKLSWVENEIHILGAPTGVKYVAVTQIDLNSLKVSGKNAYYGDIDNVFYSDEGYAFSTRSATKNTYLLPDLYTFEASSLSFTGKVDLASVLGLEKVRTIKDGIGPDGDYPLVKSVSLQGTVWRFMGEIDSIADASRKGKKMFAGTFDWKTGKSSKNITEILDDWFHIDDVLWEEDRAIVTIGSSGADGKAKIVFACFNGTEISFLHNDIVCDRVLGIDNMFLMGDPLDAIHPFIALGDGIYLRYNSTPDGFDIFDFTDSANPKCLYRSQGDIPAGCRLDFQNWGYDKNTVGVRVITPNKGEYRDVIVHWCIFSVDPSGERPFTKLGEYAETGIDYRSITPHKK